MSAVVGPERKLWLPVAVAALLAAMATLVTADARFNGPAPHAGPAPQMAEQPPWKIRISAVGTAGRPSRKSGSLKTQGTRVSEVVTDVYDALLLQPSAIGAVMQDRFTRSAARAFRAKEIGLPDTATSVRILGRRARISIEPRTPGIAVATVRARAVAVVDAKQTAISHKSTLWLERRTRGWRVVAYELDQKGPS